MDDRVAKVGWFILHELSSEPLEGAISAAETCGMEEFGTGVTLLLPLLVPLLVMLLLLLLAELAEFVGAGGTGVDVGLFGGVGADL